jgi:hypothetical protein
VHAIAGTVFENVPTRQLVHWVKPADPATVPALQAEQEELALVLENDPARQAVHAIAGTVFENVPARQLVHWVNPADPATVPT